MSRFYEDQIIDLFIAFESFFNFSHEITFRLSSYLAFLIGNNKKERSEIYDYFKKAYRIRGNLVHGKSISQKTLKSMKIDSLFDFTLKLKEYFKRAFLKIIEYSCKNYDDLEKKIFDTMF